MTHLVDVSLSTVRVRRNTPTSNTVKPLGNGQMIGEPISISITPTLTPHTSPPVSPRPDPSALVNDILKSFPPSPSPEVLSLSFQIAPFLRKTFGSNVDRILGNRSPCEPSARASRYNFTSFSHAHEPTWWWPYALLVPLRTLRPFPSPSPYPRPIP